MSKLFFPAILLFLSGFCSLAYQTVWMREFRLIFGSSTPATAAVTAVFMGILGFGSMYLGKKIPEKGSLQYYAKLEFFISLFALLSPALLWVVTKVYTGIGGTETLGMFFGTIFRLILTAVVIGIPAFCMGGTLPAIAKYCTDETDVNRRSISLLYGINTLGAVFGTVITTFLWLEERGNKGTLHLSVLINFIVVLAAFMVNKEIAKPTLKPVKKDKNKPELKLPVNINKLLTASCATGLVFFLMEMVWYRMLSPILGGSSFTYGTILATALSGIGIGGVLYYFINKTSAPTWNMFAWTAVLEGVFLAVPLFLGDSLALTAGILNQTSIFGFDGKVLSWISITMVVVFLPSVIAGIQFPILLGLAGSGDKNISSETGRVYAANTVGAIIGSLLGGFGLMRLVGAVAVWQSTVIAMLLLASYIIFSNKAVKVGFFRACFAALALWMAFSNTPTAQWRHAGIGAGRFKAPETYNNRIDSARMNNRLIHWEKDGRESAVGVVKRWGLSFIVNGKSDGSVFGDMGTQVGCGLLSLITTPQAKTALVIGLGTGSSAGWIGSFNQIEKVDVAEIEPAILSFAKDCSPVNQNVLQNSKVHVNIADAREMLLSTKKTYDIIFSEPSNPYRAGVASLFTKEFYSVAKEKLNDKGTFLQWVQAYEIDYEAIKIVCKTIGTVFNNVEIWETQSGDLLIAASKEPKIYNLETISKQLEEPTMRNGFLSCWGTETPEGVFALYIANSAFVNAIKEDKTVPINTDNKNLLEFAFAKNVGSQNRASIPDMLAYTIKNKMFLPPTNLPLNITKVRRERLNIYTNFMQDPVESDGIPEITTLKSAHTAFNNNRAQQALDILKKANIEPTNLNEYRMYAMGLIERGEDASKYILEIEKRFKLEAEFYRAFTFIKEPEKCLTALNECFEKLKTNPFIFQGTLLKAFSYTANSELVKNGKLASNIFTTMKEPFAAYLAEQSRLELMMQIAQRLGDPRMLDYAFHSYEPYTPWNATFLSRRAAYYNSVNNPLKAIAVEELKAYYSHEQLSLRIEGVDK